MSIYIVTGATSGIGKAVCNELSQRNIEYVAIGQNLERINKLDCKHKVVCDLNVLEQVSNIFKYCRENNLHLKGIIHCAGICLVQEINDIKEKDMLNVFSINVFSFIRLYKLFCSYPFIEKHSKIVALSSITANRAYKNQLLYSSSKAALNSIVKSFAQHGLEKGITVNAIEFGAVNTEMFNSLSPNIETIHRHYPLNVIDVKEAAIIVCEYLSSYFNKMTGSIVTIDSGFSVVH